MDPRRTESPVYSRQWSNNSSSTGSSQSPVMSPAHRYSTIKRTQNVAAKAAAQRLAQVMALQSNDADDYGDDGYDDEDDDLGFRVPVQERSNGRSGLPAKPPTLVRPNRSPSPALGRNFVEHHTSSVRSTSAGRPSMSVRSTTMVPPPSRTSLKTPIVVPPIQPPKHRGRDKRFTSDMGSIKLKDTEDQREASAIRDELDMLQDENEVIVEKLQHAEQRREQAEARARELEKQVASLGEGVSLEAKLLSRKEAALRQREAALKAAKQSRGGRDEEITALRSEVQNLKGEAVAALEQVQEAESEANSLRTMTQRMILTQEEMEEVVLKRCWLARYWGLAVQHGICADISASKYEHWSALAPLPFEVVISAGQRAKDESWNGGSEDSDRSKLARDLTELTGDGNIESMLSVEMGLRELASLKVEDAVVFALAQHRLSGFIQHSDSKLPGDPKLTEPFELSDAEAEDVLFKQAWLTYFWRRAKVHCVEEDIAEERLQYWISRSGHQSPTSQDAVDAERGLVELKKLSIEQQLWEASRKEIDQPLSAADSETC